MPTLVGSKLDKYDVLDEVGHGGMAVVYRGRDTILDREVAVKVLHSHLADREESRLRLQREAITVANLRHENILEIFDYSGPAQGESYIVTEFIHGPTLKEWMDEGHAPRPVIAAMIVHRLCHALSVAHRGGVVHRDIKPENVMIRRDDGCLKLMDFGIAQILDKQKLTLTGQLLGSPAYMAPELISGQPLDKRTDLFSLGILLYQLATGQLPFSGRNPHEVLNRIADGQFPQPSSINPLVDPDLEEIIRRSLSTKPDARYQTAEALASDLEDYLEEVGIEPGAAEITAYFQDPQAYVDELDARVSKALMERAAVALKDGYSARAIRLLGRVLELEPGHAEAKATLSRLRTRARRTRQLLVAGSLLAGVGLVGAGIMLFEPKPDDPVEIAAAEPEKTAPGSTRKPARPPSKTSQPLRGIAGSAGESTGTADPAPVAGAERSRRVPRPRVGTGTTSCTLKLDHVPESSAQHLGLRVGAQEVQVKETKVPIGFSGAEARVVVTGRYTASTTVTRDQCKTGVVRLPLMPAPAIITFKNAPQDMAVVCEQGCPPGNHNPPLRIPLNSEEHDRKLTIVLKADGYEDRRMNTTVYPGRNPLSGELEPR